MYFLASLSSVSVRPSDMLTPSAYRVLILLSDGAMFWDCKGGPVKGRLLSGGEIWRQLCIALLVLRTLQSGVQFTLL